MSRVHPHNQPSRGRPTLYVRNATFVRRNVPDLEVSADLTTEVTTACRFPPKLAASGVLSVIPSGRTPLLDAYSLSIGYDWAIYKHRNALGDNSEWATRT